MRHRRNPKLHVLTLPRCLKPPTDIRCLPNGLGFGVCLLGCIKNSFLRIQVLPSIPAPPHYVSIALVFATDTTRTRSFLVLRLRWLGNECVMTIMTANTVIQILVLMMITVVIMTMVVVVVVVVLLLLLRCWCWCWWWCWCCCCCCWCWWWRWL